MNTKLGSNSHIFATIHTHTHIRSFKPFSFKVHIPGNDNGNIWCLPFDRKVRLGCRKHNGKRFTSVRQNCHIRYGLNPKRENLCSASLEPRRNREMVNNKQHSIWFLPTGMNGLTQNVLLNFRLEFPKSNLPFTIYLSSGISEIFCQMVSTKGNYFFPSIPRNQKYFLFRPNLSDYPSRWVLV